MSIVSVFNLRAIERRVGGNLYKGRMSRDGDSDKMFEHPFDDGNDSGIYICHDSVSVDSIEKC